MMFSRQLELEMLVIDVQISAENLEQIDILGSGYVRHLYTTKEEFGDLVCALFFAKSIESKTDCFEFLRYRLPNATYYLLDVVMSALHAIEYKRGQAHSSDIVVFEHLVNCLRNEAIPEDLNLSVRKPSLPLFTPGREPTSRRERNARRGERVGRADLDDRDEGDVRGHAEFENLAESFHRYERGERGKRRGRS